MERGCREERDGIEQDARGTLARIITALVLPPRHKMLTHHGDEVHAGKERSGPDQNDLYTFGIIRPGTRHEPRPAHPRKGYRMCTGVVRDVHARNTMSRDPQ